MMVDFATTSSIRRARRHHSDCECEHDTLESRWKAEMCQIMHTHDREQQRLLIDQFLMDQEVEISRLLRKITHTARLDYRDRSLAMSYFGEALIRMIGKRWLAEDRGKTSTVFNYTHNLPAILVMETRDCIRSARQAGMLNGASEAPGASAQATKTKTVKRSRDLFEVEYQREPTPEELVEFHNRRMLATRKDAERQGVIISLSDLTPIQAVPMEDPSLISEPLLSTQDEPDITVQERQQRVESIVAECERLDEERERGRRRKLKREPVRMAEVARLFFQGHAQGDFPTRKELADQLGATGSAARREVGSHLTEIIELSKQEFADYQRAI